MDTFLLGLRVVVALGAVFGALFVAHRWITKGRPGQTRAKQISIVARQGLGAKAGIAIVDAHGRRYLLGVTEHAVTVLDTLGPAESTAKAVALVATAPVAVPRFDHELQTVDLGSGEIPVLVHGGGGPRPVTAAITLPAAMTTRRARRQAEQRAGAQQAGPLAGSVLSPDTWRQTASALKRLR